MNDLNASPWNISRYLLFRLNEIGIKHLFGVPGDYVLDFLDEVVAGPIQWVGTCNELNAGYAADGYARMNGAGAAVVTYAVGGFSILNAVAGAYAERVPIVVISGAPPNRRRESGALVHHLVENYRLQWEIYRKLTADAAVLSNPETAPEEIDRVLRQAILRKMPVYLEIPADMAKAACRPPAPFSVREDLPSDPDNLQDCMEEASRLINQSSCPVLLAGIELFRFGLGDKVLQLVERAEIPFATMLGSKSILPELHPQFIGIYQGSWSREAVRQQVESSDCLLSLGVWMTDLDTGMFSVCLDNRRVIAAGGGQVRIRNHYYPDIALGDFIASLSERIHPRSYMSSHPVPMDRRKQAFVPVTGAPLTASRFYERLDGILDDQMVLLAEPGDAFSAASEFHIEESENFIVQSFYASIGFCTPAALGVSMARPGKRAVVLTGDGAFQMTAQEVSTLIRNRCPALILLINNDGYLIERVLHEDGPYNDIQMWNYARLPEVFQPGTHALAMRVTTEGELEKALETVCREKEKLIFIEVCIAGRTCSQGLDRLGEAYRRSQPRSEEQPKGDG